MCGAPLSSFGRRQRHSYLISSQTQTQAPAQTHAHTHKPFRHNTRQLSSPFFLRLSKKVIEWQSCRWLIVCELRLPNSQPLSLSRTDPRPEQLQVARKSLKFTSCLETAIGQDNKRLPPRTGRPDKTQSITLPRRLQANESKVSRRVFCLKTVTKQPLIAKDLNDLRPGHLLSWPTSGPAGREGEGRGGGRGGDLNCANLIESIGRKRRGVLQRKAPVVRPAGGGSRCRIEPSRQSNESAALSCRCRRSPGAPRRLDGKLLPGLPVCLRTNR